MMERISKACITCQHYSPYYCRLKGRRISYLDCDEQTRCKEYRLSDYYKKGGKWYEKEVEKMV
jgi:hypothetical protein